ncbi:MAG: ZIP family metal transporter [archaeon]|nr:ZIP family metal transporter [archaeon]
MHTQSIYILGSVILVSLISLIGLISLSMDRKFLNRILLILVSISAGTLFGGAFLHLLPEAVEMAGGFTINISLYVLGGIVVFFILEKIIHFHHHHHAHNHKESLLHEPHPHHIGVMNLIGDGLHNFLDGLIIAGAYFVSIPVGIATTVAVIFHEIPQELADFGVLLYAGFSKGKAIVLNLISALVAVVGALIGIFFGASSQQFIAVILPFAAGGFLYIAGSNLIPELHKHCKLKESFIHLFALLLGIGITAGLLFVK